MKCVEVEVSLCDMVEGCYAWSEAGWNEDRYPTESECVVVEVIRGFGYIGLMMHCNGDGRREPLEYICQFLIVTPQIENLLHPCMEKRL